MKIRNATVLLVLAAVVLTGAALTISAQSPAARDQIVTHKMPEQVVLYTIHRGGYDKMGQTIGRLFALAGQKGMMPPKGSLMYAYLNNPNLVSSEHWLTEIRIPVAAAALKLTGQLGEMTDVKKLPAMDVIVAVKPEGVSDPAGIYKNVSAWARKNNYVALDGFMEIFLTNTMSGDYARMKSEIMLPVARLDSIKDKGAP